MAGDNGNGSMPPWARVIFQWGFAAAMASYLLYMLAGGIQARVDNIDRAVHDHITETRFYLRAMCRIMAKQAGEPEGRCEP